MIWSAFVSAAADIAEDDLARLVPLFYERVRADPDLGPVFEAAVHDWPEHLDRLIAFWSSVSNASGRYKGNPFAAHMKLGDRITPALFQRWLTLWGETASEVLPPAAAATIQARAERIADSLQAGLFFRPDTLPPRPGRIPA